MSARVFPLCGVLLFARVACAQEPGTKLWEFTTTDGLLDEISSPAIGPDGTIYFTARSGPQESSLFALNPDGTKKWSRAERYGGTAVIGAEGTIYVCGGDRWLWSLFAVNPDGTRLWSYSEANVEPRLGIAVAGDGVLYFGAGYGLHAVNAHGTRNWVVGDETHSPTISRDGTVYHLGARSVKAVLPDGTPVNHYFQAGNDAMGPLAIGADGTIYSGYRGGGFYALNPDLTVKWGAGLYTSSEPVIANDGTVYVAGGSLFALTPDGSIKWVFSSGFAGYAAPAVADDGTVYFSAGSFFAVNPDGSERWRFTSGARSSPAIAGDGTVYLAGTSKLYALKGTARLARSAWPMEGHDLRRSRKASCFTDGACFDVIQRRTTGGVALTLIGDEMRDYSLEASGDLVDWTVLTNGASANGTLFFLDTSTNVTHRFYRARSH